MRANLLFESRRTERESIEKSFAESRTDNNPFLALRIREGESDSMKRNAGGRADRFFPHSPIPNEAKEFGLITRSDREGGSLPFHVATAKPSDSVVFLAAVAEIVLLRCSLSTRHVRLSAADRGTTFAV